MFIWTKREIDVCKPSGPCRLLSCWAKLKISTGHFSAMVKTTSSKDEAPWGVPCGRGPWGHALYPDHFPLQMRSQAQRVEVTWPDIWCAFSCGMFTKWNHSPGWNTGESRSNHWHPWALLRSRSQWTCCKCDVIPSTQQPTETGTSPDCIFIGHWGPERLSVLTKVTSSGSLRATPQPSPGSKSRIPSLLPSYKDREIVK